MFDGMQRLTDLVLDLRHRSSVLGFDISLDDALTQLEDALRAEGMFD